MHWALPGSMGRGGREEGSADWGELETDLGSRLGKIVVIACVHSV